MKKTLLIALTMMCSVVLMAQESAAELKNAGNAAYKLKDYKIALEKYVAYLAHPEMLEDDLKTYTYNCGYCAYKVDDFETAIEYLSKSVDLDYKPDLASYYIALSKKKSGDEDAYIEDMKMMVVKYPKSKYYKKYFLSAVVTHYAKLAAEPYNKGNEIASQAATSGDAGVYLKKMKDAIAKWEESKVHFEKVLELDGTNPAATAALANIQSQVKSYESYKLSLKEN